MGEWPYFQSKKLLINPYHTIFQYIIYNYATLNWKQKKELFEDSFRVLRHILDDAHQASLGVSHTLHIALQRKYATSHLHWRNDDTQFA